VVTKVLVLFVPDLTVYTLQGARFVTSMAVIPDCTDFLDRDIPDLCSSWIRWWPRENRPTEGKARGREAGRWVGVEERSAPQA
jgi:hypothetical protein